MTTPYLRFRPTLLAVFFLSFSVLIFEIALTRVFSVMLSYHYVFAIVSIAMLGLGLGGFLFLAWGLRFSDFAIRTAAIAFSVLLAAVVLAIVNIPVGIDLLSDLSFWIYLILAVLPFSAAGFAISGLFQVFSKRSSLLYGADLLGAAAAALAVIPAMDAFGAVNVIFLAASVAALGAFFLSLPKLRPSLISLSAMLALGTLFGTVVLMKISVNVPITPDPNKEMSQMLANPAFKAKIVESRWSSFGRTDLLKSELLPNEMTLFVDGAAGSAMYNIKAILKDKQETEHLTLHFGEFFPFFLLKPEEKRTALTIGPGGGRDVVVALLGGVKSIKAVEVNPDVVQYVKDYSQFNGGLYTEIPQVTAIVGEGRNYVKTSKDFFDLIMLSIPVTKSTRSVEGYALTENNLYTVEAFGDYLNRLTENGRMVIVAHGDAEIYKIISLALAAFKKQGIPETEAMKHLYTVGSDMMPAIVIQKKALTIDEATKVHDLTHQLGFDKVAYYIPFIKQDAANPGERLGVGKNLRMFDKALVAVANGEIDMETLAQKAPLNIQAPTDDRPFFFQFDKKLPSPFGAFVVIIASVLAVLVYLCLLAPKAGSSSKTFVGSLRRHPGLKLGLLLFFAVGVGYMLIEIAFFQKLITFFGQPQKAMSTLLFSLLLGNGIGSLLSADKGQRWTGWKGSMAATGVAALGLPALLLFPLLMELGIDPQWGASLVLIPLGILMGSPLPLAIRTLDRLGLGRHVATMWGINGIASVVGSALAMIVGISLGFVWAISLGVVFYVLVAFLFYLLARTSPSVEEEHEASLLDETKLVLEKTL